MHTEIVKVLLELELEGPLSAGAQHTNAWLGQERLRAAAQDKYWVASSLDGWDHGVYKVHTHGARRGCREAVAWLGAGSPATAAARAGASTEQPNARKSCARQVPWSAGKAAGSPGA